jgi:hypothetical protein
MKCYDFTGTGEKLSPINNFATLTPCTAEALTPLCSPISLPKDMSEVILNLVPSKKKNGVRTSAAQEIWLQNYLLLFL